MKTDDIAIALVLNYYLCSVPDVAISGVQVVARIVAFWPFSHAILDRKLFLHYLAHLLNTSRCLRLKTENVLPVAVLFLFDRIPACCWRH